MKHLIVLATIGGLCFAPRLATGTMTEAKYTATFCQKYWEGGDGIYSTTFGRVGNASSSDWLTLGCPIISRTDGTSVWPIISVVDVSDADDVSCQFQSVSDTAIGITGSFDTTTSFGNSTVPQNLQFPMHAPGINVVHQVACNLPPAVGGAISRIVSYEWNWYQL